MSPGKEAYEKQKQEKRRLKMDQEDAYAKRKAREAKSEQVTDLLVDCLTAFLTGKASLIVETVDDNTRRISFAVPV